MISYILMCISTIFLLIVNASITKFNEKFNNYNIYEVTAFNARERAVLYNLHMKEDDMIFVNGISNEAALPMDVLVNDCCTYEFESIMQVNAIEFIKVTKENLINTATEINIHQYTNKKSVSNFTTDFHCYDKIVRWMINKDKRHSILEQIKIGQTYEKRDIIVLKISTGKKKKCVFLMGGEEGKDWSSAAILLNFVDYILKNKLQIYTQLYDFYILPIFNPDGYTYSMTKDRLWTKNTRVSFPNKPCRNNRSAVGINVDRNWYFNKLTVDNTECDPIFIGSKPISEQENIAVSKFLNKIALSMMAFINVRGTDNLVTIPYGYDKEYCNNYYILMDMLSAVYDLVMKQHNTSFNYGLASKYIYNFSGSSADWVKKHLNTPIVYTIYMKVEPFLLPSPADIQPLTTQLSTMIEDILLSANTFYGNMFNNEIGASNIDSILTINLFFINIIITILS